MAKTVQSAPQHYLVTGASGGIGSAVVDQLLGSGRKVTGVSRRPGGRSDPRYAHLAMDLSDLQALSAADAVFRGLSPLNGVICCHGIGDFGSVEQFSADRIRQLIDINLTSIILLTRVLMPLLRQQGDGAMVVVGSEAALRGGRQGAVYAASKFGLRGLTQSLREEASSAGVRVTLINPGMVDTPFFDALHFEPGADPANALNASDVADAVMQAINAPSHVVIDEINLSPLKKVVQHKNRQR